MEGLKSAFVSQPWAEHGKCLLYCAATLYFLLWLTFGKEVVFDDILWRLPRDFFIEEGKRIGVVAVMLVELVLLPWVCKMLSRRMWIAGVSLLVIGLVVPHVVSVADAAGDRPEAAGELFNVYTVVTGLALLGCLVAKFLATMTVYGVHSDGATVPPRMRS